MKNKNEQIKKLASRYVKTVEWSEADRCFVGQCPELFFGGVHGNDEVETYRQLCDAIEDVLEARLRHGDRLPEPSIAPKYSGRFLLRMPRELHKALAVRAFRAGMSLNDLCLRALRKGGVRLHVH